MDDKGSSDGTETVGLMPSLMTSLPVTAYPPATLADDELAAVLGITREGARKLVICKQWERQKGNDGRARILMIGPHWVVRFGC